MGYFKLAKVLTKVAKKAKKTDAPFYGAVGTILGGRQLYKKIRHGKTDWGEIKEAREKRKEKKIKKDK
jgi:hypothetical protein